VFTTCGSSHKQLAWSSLEKKYRAELKRPDQAHLLNMLAALSHQANFAIGCYCEDESRCHRSILRTVLQERGAKIA
jgi:uncharacterized protein YeaO (DUF488 family)